MDRGAIRRWLALGTATLTASGLLALAAPGAQAAAPTRCQGREVKTLAFSTGVTHVYRQNGYVCALTVTRRPGVAVTMSVSVQARGGRPVVDKGRYRYQAGPITVHAGHRCVKVTGAVGNGSVRTGWILC
ncbi:MULTISPECIES: hypothetical protein [Streptomyces]|uniref:Secreted protein n=2 Tax=Streptomyces TaxID=1883 RepID=A0A2U9P179_STRAS|nr:MULTISPECIES: hypothetical protein [Streptomyces]AWT43410.1 hypothetical protein DMT42_14515 [Streptomyces actuosus]MBM4824410.1 hypothetical protein [Streptomyces actuosus]GHF67724.1 hypothetical protein GCM10018783_41280 [Streptomyces griseosporeus]